MRVVEIPFLILLPYAWGVRERIEEIGSSPVRNGVSAS